MFQIKTIKIRIPNDPENKRTGCKAIMMRIHQTLTDPITAPEFLDLSNLNSELLGLFDENN